MQSGQSRRRSGFTLVEIVMVIAVLAILVGVVVMSYGAWQQSIAGKSVQSDLSQATSQLKNYLNFNNAYPATLDFKSAANVTIKYTRRSDTSFCLNGVSTRYATVKYYTTETQQKPIAGSCT